MFGTDCQTRSCVFCTAVLCVLCSNYWTGAVTDKTSQRRDSSPPTFRRRLGLPPHDSSRQWWFVHPIRGMGFGRRWDGPCHPSTIDNLRRNRGSRNPRCHTTSPSPPCCILLVPPTRARWQLCRLCRLSGNPAAVPSAQCALRAEDCIAWRWLSHDLHSKCKEMDAGWLSRPIGTRTEWALGRAGEMRN